jgi:hypothetical protein
VMSAVDSAEVRVRLESGGLRGVTQSVLRCETPLPFQNNRPHPPRMTPDERSCRVCGVVKRSEEFARDQRRSGGRASICKECDRERSRRYDAEHREERRAAYRARNPEPQSWAERLERRSSPDTEQ